MKRGVSLFRDLQYWNAAVINTLTCFSPACGWHTECRSTPVFFLPGFKSNFCVPRVSVPQEVSRCRRRVQIYWIVAYSEEGYLQLWEKTWGYKPSLQGNCYEWEKTEFKILVETPREKFVERQTRSQENDVRWVLKWCYVMLCYVMLCYVMLRCVMLCYVAFVMLCYVTLCYVTLCYVTLCYVMLCYVMLCYVALCYVMKLWAESCAVAELWC
jgi:hypothetical protein